MALTTAPWHSVNPHKYFLSHYLSYYPDILGRVWHNLTTKQDEFWLEPHSVEDRLLNCYVCPDSSEVDSGQSNPHPGGSDLGAWKTGENGDCL